MLTFNPNKEKIEARKKTRVPRLIAYLESTCAHIEGIAALYRVNLEDDSPEVVARKLPPNLLERFFFLKWAEAEFERRLDAEPLPA